MVKQPKPKAKTFCKLTLGKAALCASVFQKRAECFGLHGNHLLENGSTKDRFVKKLLGEWGHKDGKSVNNRYDV